MPKLRGPLLSFDARGVLGKLLSFTHRQRKPIVERKPIPTDAKSSSQLFFRHMFTKCVDLWHTLSDAEKQEWESAARPKHMTGYAWYISQCLKPNPGIYLPLQGGTMSGDIDMAKNKLLKLPIPTDDQEAASKKYHDDNKYTNAEADARIALHAAVAAAHHAKTVLFTTLTDRWTLAQAHRGALNKIMVFQGPGADPIEEDKPAAGAVLVVAETEVFNGIPPLAWTDLDLSGTIGANAALVLLKVGCIFTNTTAVRKNGDTDEFYSIEDLPFGCALSQSTYTEHFIVLLVAASDSGIIEWKCERDDEAITVDIIAYIK